MNYLLILLASLAVFRGAEMIAIDAGPFEIFKRLRSLFPQGSQMDKMIECQYCNGAWLALSITLLYWWAALIPGQLFAIWWFAIAGGAVAIMRTVRPRKP